MRNPFSIELSKIIIENLFNNYQDNHDSYRFGPSVKDKPEGQLPSWIRERINKKGYYSVPATTDYAVKCLDAYASKINYFEYLYNLLEDDYSRNLLIKVCAYRILGKNKIKLPMNNPEYWNSIIEINKNLKSKDSFINAQVSGIDDFKLTKFNLASLGYPIEIYFNPVGIYFDFVYKCYNFNYSGVNIGVEEGDTVIDGGGCWGDTALYFANAAGKNGKVYSFEFVPSNTNIFGKNIDLNKDLKERIELVKSPLWSASKVPVYFESDGPGTKVSMNKISSKSETVLTLTIDDLYKEKQLKKVDFIKMDIEGAEVNALKGAEHVLKTCRPKLAISLYHKESDFKDIPEYIKSLNLGYKFYFNHYTMHSEESVLFCNV